MDIMVTRIPCACAYLGDIVVTGASREKHTLMLKKALERLKTAKLRLNCDKCKSLKSYYSATTSMQQESISPGTIHAIVEAPPKTFKQIGGRRYRDF